ncbi:hypothetical protein KIN20_032985 [Parelaphostrongylus tenuis]|uniref:Uncharacterized protein n=1 Tax=Parelaphostrongylus tenuis TaxID=148309 RepID=A0AAD5WHW1_PARTN|nr:hypothetical protein KIN20_032985 [Parelaphostrongylus tenuis]
MVFIIFSLMICHYRNRFKLQKKIHEGDTIITKSLNIPPIRPMKISPVMPIRMVGTCIPAIGSGYAIQEKKMIVGGDDSQQPVQLLGLISTAFI